MGLRLPATWLARQCALAFQDQRVSPWIAATLLTHRTTTGHVDWEPRATVPPVLADEGRNPRQWPLCSY
jgi:hypothetical protein